MLKANVTVTLKKSIFDPQGSAVEKALKSMEYPVESVRIGKFMEVTLAESDKTKAGEIMDEICRKLLSNPVIEDYSFELEG
jgi:phosphoribosylformylglycinamidine synthase PurS subunit